MSLEMWYQTITVNSIVPTPVPTSFATYTLVDLQMVVQKKKRKEKKRGSTDLELLCCRDSSLL